MAYDAVRAGVAYVPGAASTTDGQPTNSLRLTYSVANAEQILTGIAALGRLVAKGQSVVMRIPTES